MSDIMNHSGLSAGGASTGISDSPLSKLHLTGMHRAHAIDAILSSKPRFTVAEAVPEVTRQLLSSVERSGNDPIFLFVGAASASGKGWVTDRIQEELEKHLGPGSVSILSTDRYFKGATANNTSTELRRSAALASGRDPESVRPVSFDDPEGLDFETLRSDILRMQRRAPGETVPVPTYSFTSGERSGEEQFKIGRVVMVEGLYPLSDALLDCPGLRVFINANEITRLIRRLSRDALERGFISPAEQFPYHLAAIRPTVDGGIIPTAANASIIIDNNLDPVHERVHVPSIRSKRQFKVVGTPKDTDFTKLHGMSESHLTERDRYFIHPDEIGKSDPNFLRLRHSGGESERAICTYKWPSLNNDAERSILSFPIGADAIKAIERIFEGGEQISLEKTRTSWSIPVGLGLVHVHVDRNISRTERSGTVTQIPDTTEFSWDAGIPKSAVDELAAKLFPGHRAEAASSLPYVR